MKKVMMCAMVLMLGMMVSGYVYADDGVVKSEDVISAVQKHIDAVGVDKDGIFPAQDKDGNNLKLRLDKIHDTAMFIKEKGVFFVCADMNAEDGALYDVDFWVKKKADGSLNVVENILHKKDGEVIFDYKAEGLTIVSLDALAVPEVPSIEKEAPSLKEMAPEAPTH